MHQTTEKLPTDFKECPHCEKSFPSRVTTRCPHCNQPVQDYAVSRPPFGPKTRVILEIMPSGTCVPFDVEDTVIMGRVSSQTDHLNIFDLTPFKGNRRGVSRAHCEVRRTSDRLLVRDLGSTNGTYLNGERLESGKEYPVEHGDDLILGELLLTVYFSPAQAGS